MSVVDGIPDPTEAGADVTRCPYTNFGPEESVVVVADNDPLCHGDGRSSNDGTGEEEAIALMLRLITC